MSDSAPGAREERETDLVAADWMIRRDRGLTPAEQDEFLQWLAADPRHGAWFARHQETWGELNLLAQWRPHHSAEPNPDLLARRRPTRLWFWPALLAVAACAVFAGWLWHSRGVSALTGGRLASSAVTASTYRSRILDDGSLVELNGDAVVETNFTTAERRVRLTRGEAHFTIAKNPERPFLVHAGGVDVRAVGTAFNVRLGAKEVEVLVTEGRVRVRPPAPDVAAARSTALVVSAPLPSSDFAVAPELGVGDRTVVSLEPQAPPPRIVHVTPPEIERLLAWQPKLLDFNSTPLAQVVAEFNRRNHVKLILADPALGATPIVASFRSDNLDGFVRLLELSVGVRAERSEDTITLHRAR